MEPIDLTLLDLVAADELCVACGHTAEQHADELPARCDAHGDAHPCDCEAFVPAASLEKTVEEDAA